MNRFASVASPRRLLVGALALALSGAAGTAAAIDAAERAAYADRVNFDALDADAGHSQLIVHFEPASRLAADATQRSQAIARIAAQSGKDVELVHVRELAAGGHLLRVRGAAGTRRLDRTEMETLLVAFARDPDVAYVEPDVRLTAGFTPNDPKYPLQWNYHSGTAGINVAGAWHYATGAGVTVAVIDTGIVPHSDLDANIVGGYDFIADADAARDGDGRDANPADEGDWWTNSECGPTAPPAWNSSWHGTHVAGIVAAVTNNANAVAGVAYDAKVVPVRVLGKCGGMLSDIADAVVWSAGGSVANVPANAHPAKVINMSLGGQGSCGATYQNAINSAYNSGTVVVVAAGNSAANVSGFRPGNCNNVISVAALTKSAKLASFSNYGNKIDVGAPGVGIPSTLNDGDTVPGNETTANYDGTSQATPQVAGLAAMILSEANKTPAIVESLIKCQATSVDCAFDDTKSCGWGLINTLRTMKMVAMNNDNCVGVIENPLFQPTVFTNGYNYTIPASDDVESPNTVWGRIGNAPSSLKVEFTISAYRGGTVQPNKLKLELIAPDSTKYLLFNQGAVLPASATVNASSELANGLWKLRVTNSQGTINGYINTWTLKFQ